MLIFIAFWAVILLVVPYLCLFSLILQGLFEEGEFRQLEFWTGKGANPSPLFCTSPNALKSYVDFLGLYKKYWAKELPEGGCQGATSPATATPWWRRASLWGPQGPPPLIPAPSLFFHLQKKLFRSSNPCSCSFGCDFRSPCSKHHSPNRFGEITPW